MSKFSIWKIVVVCAAVLFNDGCGVTKRITLRSDISDPLETGPLMILTKDSSLYELTNYKLMDSTLVGTGSVRKRGTTQRFDGELKLSGIGYIQAQSLNGFKGLLTVSSTGYFVGWTLSSFTGHEGFSLQTRITYPGGSGHSCPFIYSWDGKRHHMEGEAFGVGLGKALEVTTCVVLNSIKEDQGKLAVRLTNERPETHHFNVVKLVGVECDTNAQVYSDANGILWPVYVQASPIRAEDNSGRIMTDDVSYRDGNYWESNFPERGMSSDFRDAIDLTIVNSNHANEGSIVIHAMNTHLSESVFDNIFSFLGDESLAFVNAAEHDSVMIRILKEWLEESSLKAYIFNGSTWDNIGVIYPEADNIQFSKLIRLKISRQMSDTIRIRLTCLADVWKIDAVGVDWTPVTPLKQNIVPLLSAVGSRGEDLRHVLLTSDEEYAVLLPPDMINLKFRASNPVEGKKTAYAIYVGGYLYEWPSGKGSDALKALSPMISQEMKIPYLKTLLQNKSIFLPVIYSEWRKKRFELSSTGCTEY